MAKAEAKISWLPMRVIVSRVARHLGCAPEDAWLRIVEEGEAGRIRACGLTVEGWPMSPLPATWRGIDWDAGPLLSCDDLIAADLLPGRSEERSGWWANQALAWITRRELEWTPEMGKEIKPAQLKLSEAIAARRINPWGRRPGSLQFEPISNDLFSPSEYKVLVTIHADLSTEPPHKRHEFEEEYKDDSKWRYIIFGEDEIRREWLPAGCAASAHESTEIAEESMPEPVPAVEPTPPAESAKPAAAPHLGGRPPVVNWKMVEEEVFRLMNHHGEFSLDDDPEWNAQARLDEAIADFCEDKFKKLPSETTIKEHVRQALERWRRSRSET